MAAPQPPPLKKSGVWGFWAGQNLPSVHWPSLGATALRSCWWNSWGTPHPECCSGALISAKGWVNRSPRQPCAQYFNVFTRSSECSQDFEKQSGKKKPQMLFFYPGIVFSQTFRQCWPSDTPHPVQEHSHSSEAAPSGSRRIKEKDPREKPQIPRAQEPRAAPGNEEQHCSGEPATGSVCAPVCHCEYYLLIKRRKNN